MGWAAARDNAHLAGAGRYQAFTEEARLVADDAGDATRVPQDSRSQEERAALPPHEDHLGDFSDGADEAIWGREGVRRPEGSRQSRPRAGQRFPREVARQGYGDAPVGGGAEQDDEDTRQWEADDHRDWPGQERSGWGGRSTGWNGNPDARQGSDHRRLNGGVGGGDALAGRGSAARGGEAELAKASARGKRAPQLPQPPPPPPPPPIGAAALGEDALHQNGNAAGRRETFEEEEEEEGEEEDEFGDGQAWGDVDTADERTSEAPLMHSNSSGGHQRLSGGGRGGANEPWPRPAQQDSAARAGKALQGAPPQSKLVQRVFGRLGRRGRGGGRGRGSAGRGGRGGARDGGGTQEDGGEQGAGSESWALQAELQGKLQELEEEVRAFCCCRFGCFFWEADEGRVLLIVRVGWSVKCVDGRQRNNEQMLSAGAWTMSPKHMKLPSTLPSTLPLCPLQNRFGYSLENRNSLCNYVRSGIWQGAGKQACLARTYNADKATTWYVLVAANLELCGVPTVDLTPLHPIVYFAGRCYLGLGFPTPLHSITFFAVRCYVTPP